MFTLGPPAALPITRQTAFRKTGDISLDRWLAEFGRAPQTQLSRAQIKACYDACSGVQAMVLDRFRVESFFATTNTGRNNFLGLRDRSGQTLAFEDFSSAAACVKELVRRWTDPAYKQGVYGPQNLSIEGMIAKYSPPHENDTEALIRACVDNINAWRAAEGDTGGDDVNWSPLPYPEMTDLIVEKPAYDGAGFYRVPARGPRIVGVCDHITDGEGSAEFYSRFFGTGGERAWDALVDTVIPRTGPIGLLNDWRDPNRGGTRAGWANGGEGADTNQGVEFYRNYPAINDVLVSKEHVTTAGKKLNDHQIEESAKLTAAVLHNESRCPWSTVPRNPNRNNVVVSLIHTDFAAKSCPAEPFISTHRPVILKRAQEIMKAQQGGSGLPPSPPPPPTPPPIEYPFGFTEEAVSFFFGTLTRYDGQEFGFDPTGMISLLWLKRCEKEGKFPESESWVKFGNREVVQWEGGWTAIRDDARGAFAWLDSGAPEPRVGGG